MTNILNKKPYFFGFNTVDQSTPPYSLTNVEAVKRDISNHFATPIGSRVMLPKFGTSIYDYLFDPFDEYTKGAIIAEAERVISLEPRVSLVDIDAQQDEKSLSIAMLLIFKPEDITDNLFVSFSLQNSDTF